MAKQAKKPVSKKSEDVGKYNVLISFTDDKDENVVYRAGKDEYPRDGYKPTAERIKYLTGDTNKFGKPIIEKK